MHKLLFCIFFVGSLRAADNKEEFAAEAEKKIAQKYKNLADYKRKHMASRTTWNRVAGLGWLLCSASYFYTAYQGVMPMATYPAGLVGCGLCGYHCEENSCGIGSFFYDWQTEWNYVYRKEFKWLNKLYKRE